LETEIPITECKVCYKTCSPNFEKLAERMDGETMISLFENLSTRDEAFTMVEIFLLDSQSRKLKRDIKHPKTQTISNKV